MVVTQWGYSGGAVAASGSTHDGGGVWDIVLRDAGAGDWTALDDLIELAGGYSWQRTPADGFIDHLHVGRLG